MKKNVIYTFFRKIDIFGKEPQFYYKKGEKKKSNIGSIFTIIYFILYVSLFSYKLYRLVKKKGGTFSDSNINPEKYESIHLTNENFYFGFAIEDPLTYDTIFDDSIYYVKAYYKKAVREEDIWEWTVKEIETERCQIEKFGSKYQKLFGKKSMNLHHCLKEMNFTMEGHFSYDVYSLLYLSIFPCKNTTENGNHCKPIEVIDHYLKGTFVSIQMQDISLTPEDYNNPVKERDQDIYTTVGKKLFKELHIFFKITNIETNMDVIGIDEIKNVKNEKFIKYDTFSQMTKLLETDIYETGESFCDITIKLSDLVFYQKRNYSKLLEILGELGGLMEVLMTVFKFFLSYYTDTLYEMALVNSLFNFEIESKPRIIEKQETEVKKEENLPKPINKNRKLQLMNITGGETNEDLKLESNKYKRLNRRKSKTNFIFSSNMGLFTIKSKFTTNEPKENKITNEINEKNNEEIKNNNEIINKIKYNKFCFYCFIFCYSKNKGKKNILLKEGIDIIKEDLDIINILKQIYKDTNITRNFNCIK